MWEISCDLCNIEVIHPDQQAPHRVKKSRWVAGKRQAGARYVGQTGRSLHKRAQEHREGVRRGDSKCPLMKHQLEKHNGDTQNPVFTMRKLTTHKSNLNRMITEGLLIESAREFDPEAMLNSKAEFGRTKMIRFNPEVMRY